MTTLIIVMLVCGIGFIGISFFVKDDEKHIHTSQNELAKETEQAVSLSEKQKEEIRSQINEIIEEQLHGIDDRTEASLDRISNTKILEMNEYADTIMNEISRNHNETVFLYDMLNEKAKEVKGTVKDINQTKEQVQKLRKNEEKLQSRQTLITEKTKNIHADDSQDEAKERLKVLSKQHQEKKEQAPNDTQMQKGQAHELNVLKEERQENNTKHPVMQNERNRRILELYESGMNAKDIAKQLSMGIGEVRLVIGLYNN